MIEVKSRLRRWGRSFGIVVPMEEIRREGLSEEDELRVFISKKKSPVRETFGIAKFKRSTKEILDEGDRESWDE